MAGCFREGLHRERRKDTTGRGPWEQQARQPENINNDRIGKSSGRKWVEVNRDAVGEKKNGKTGIVLLRLSGERARGRVSFAFLA